jgi:hypothetical protein
MTRLLTVLLLTSLSVASSAHALEEPVREVRSYPDPMRETVARIRTARVLTADYELLRQDFPQLSAKTNAKIDQWLLDQAAYMSLPQVRNPLADQLNTPIASDESELRSAWRPEGYGRGLVYEVNDGSGNKGLLDGKGFGALAPSVGFNRSGLLPLNEALREMIWEQTIAGIFNANGGRFNTARTYAVFDWGFDVKNSDGTAQPAGAVLRQAHTREHWNFNSNLPKEEALEIELLLRRYGITSAGLSESLRRQGQVPYDLINVQGRRLPNGGAMVVDFGTYVRVADDHRFTRSIAVRETRFFSPQVLNNDVGANREVGVLSGILAPGQPGFVDAPELTATVPVERFGLPDPARLYPETDLVSSFATDAIAAFRKQGRAALEQTLKTLRESLGAPLDCERLLLK